MATHALTALRAAARECQLAAASFNDEQAAEGLAAIDELRAHFLSRPASAASAQAGALLLQLPLEILSVILSMLSNRELACLAASCHSLWLDAPAPPPPPMPPRQVGLVETELRRRAEARGLHVGSSLPEGALLWVPYLLKRDRCNAQTRQASLAVVPEHSMFVDTESRLLTCGYEGVGDAHLLGHAVDPAADPYEPREIGPPTPVPSMQGRRIVSVASSPDQCLALSADGEAYSWGNGDFGALGHGDEDARAVPCRIESLSRIELIAVGPDWTSAAVDADGRLFTWGRASLVDEEEDSDGEQKEAYGPNSLGHLLDAEPESQLTPKRAGALSQERVTGVALGFGFTLAVTDAGAVFSFGLGEHGELGHDSLTSVVLPRRMNALAQTGRRFVTVAAGNRHALALTEEGELYGWGHEQANGHGSTAARRCYRGDCCERTPLPVAAFGGQRVKLVDARDFSSCAVTERDELFTWGICNDCNLGRGHRPGRESFEPKQVHGLSGVKVAAVAIGATHTPAADEDGVVWAFGRNVALGLDTSRPGVHVETPTPIPALRVRVLDSP